MKSPIIEIYTDGSCISSDSEREAIGAWVAIIFIDKDKYILKDIVQNTTHNRMELLAVIRAVKFIIDKNIGEHTLTIYSDSQYVVHLQERKERLKGKNFITAKGTPVQNADLVKTLIHQIETYPIEFVKVKAHQKKDDTGNYNREADLLCRKLARDFFAGK